VRRGLDNRAGTSARHRSVDRKPQPRGLQRAGLITSKRSADDGRQTDVRLTIRGRRKAEAITAATARAFGALIEQVPRSERQRVTEAVEILARAVMASDARE